MKTLSREAFRRARDFLATRGRSLEWALFQYYFEGGPVEAARAELARYGNEDGGFGNALEPDLRNPHSSALATEHALNLLKELDTPPDHPLVAAGVQWLVDHCDPQRLVWRVIPPDSDEYPHAPWWDNTDGGLAARFDHYLVIPRARIVGLLHHYAALAPAGWLNQVTEATVSALVEMPELGSGGGDDLVYALSLLESERLPEPYRERLAPRLRTAVVQAVSREPRAWEGYSIEPLKLAPSPQSFAAGLLEEILPLNLDFRIERQTSSGAWDPVWTWSDLFPQTWPVARQEWRGELTLRNLLILRAYGRIEG